MGSGLARFGLHLLSGFHDVVVFALHEVLLDLELVSGLLVLPDVALESVVGLSQSVHLFGHLFHLLFILLLELFHLFEVAFFDGFPFFQDFRQVLLKRFPGFLQTLPLGQESFVLVKEVLVFSFDRVHLLL